MELGVKPKKTLYIIIVMVLLFRGTTIEDSLCGGVLSCHLTRKPEGADILG
jgi:hypothetical protein